MSDNNDPTPGTDSKIIDPKAEEFPCNSEVKPVTDPAKRHRTMQKISMEKDIFHVAPDGNIDGDLTVAESLSACVTTVPEPVFFSGTIIAEADVRDSPMSLIPATCDEEYLAQKETFVDTCVREHPLADHIKKELKMTENTPLKRNAPMLTEVEKKELADQKAKNLSKNPDEAVEKSIAKSSSDEAKAKPA